MAYSKVILNNTVLMDVTQNTVAADKLLSGVTAVGKDGSTITGTVSTDPIVEKDVNFIDYDGTLVASYTAAEFANLSAMPANPSHSGLTAQGWNWSLADAKTYVASYGKLWIGQMYITDDGKTRLYIHIADVARNVVPLYWSQTVSEGVTINWGDGSAEETVAGSLTLGIYLATTSHTYSSTGDYIITLKATSGTFALGYGKNNVTVFGSDTSTLRVYKNMLKAVEIGNNVSELSNLTFYGCFSLNSITIPNTITTIGSFVFNSCYSLLSITIPSNVVHLKERSIYYCYSLRNVSIPKAINEIDNELCYNCYTLSDIIIPNEITTIPNSAFYNCVTLTNIIIPNGITTISSSVFYNCYSLINIIIPNSVTSIDSYAFYGCKSVKEYHLLPTTPPTLSNTNAFTSIPSDCIIYVPYSADHSILNAYKTASNWSTYADYMQEEPQS